MKKYLNRPFDYIGGGLGLAIGGIILLISIVSGYFFYAHYDGAIDVHIGTPSPWYVFALEVLTDWFCLSIVLFLVGSIAGKSKIRFIDLLGTVAIARFPLALIGPLGSIAPIHKLSVNLTAGHKAIPMTSNETVIFIFFLILTVGASIWFFILLYQAYSTSCNVKGRRGIVSFIIAIIMAEVLTGILLSLNPLIK